MAQEASTRQPEAPLAGAHVGDARSLPWEDGAADVVLLLGPLYHLTDARDRQRTLAEAYRALKPEGVLLASAISRYASTIDGLRSGYLKDPDFAAMVERDLVDGQHRNPTGDPAFFMDNFFHHPDELRDEIATAGFAIGGIYGIEGLCCLLDDAVFDEWWADETLRRRLLSIARTLEAETPLLGASGHLMAVGRKEA
jgi:SAM-dependent methyltransferase